MFVENRYRTLFDRWRPHRPSHRPDARGERWVCTRVSPGTRFSLWRAFNSARAIPAAASSHVAFHQGWKTSGPSNRPTSTSVSLYGRTSSGIRCIQHGLPRCCAGNSQNARAQRNRHREHLPLWSPGAGSWDTIGGPGAATPRQAGPQRRGRDGSYSGALGAPHVIGGRAVGWYVVVPGGQPGYIGVVGVVGRGLSTGGCHQMGGMVVAVRLIPTARPCRYRRPGHVTECAARSSAVRLCTVLFAFMWCVVGCVSGCAMCDIW